MPRPAPHTLGTQEQVLGWKETAANWSQDPRGQDVLCPLNGFLPDPAGSGPSHFLSLIFQNIQYLEEEAMQAVTDPPTRRFRNSPVTQESSYGAPTLPQHSWKVHLPSPTPQGPSQGSASRMFLLTGDRQALLVHRGPGRPTPRT